MARRPRILVGTVVVLTALHALALLAFKAAFKDLIPRWQASQYWLGYEHGFVRRGLPGEVLRLLAGGPPTYAEMTVFAVLLSGAAAVALVALALLLRRSACAEVRSVVVVLLVVSPFTLSLLAWDTGRYDAVGIVVLVAMAALLTAPGRLSPAAVLVGIAVLATVAVLSEEFLVAFVVPTVLLGVWSVYRRPVWREAAPSPWIGALVAVGPACIAAVASVVCRPDPSAVWATFAAARTAGVDIQARPGTSAVTAMLQTPGDTVDFVLRLSLVTRNLLVLGLAAFYLLSTALIWYVVGPARETPLSCAVVALHGASAVGLGLVGVDYRRWWALAFVAAMASYVIIVAGRAVDEPVRPPRWTSGLRVVVGGTLLLSVAAQTVPVFPTWERSLGSRPPPAYLILDALWERVS